jgi:hypothetical protein
MKNWLLLAGAALTVYGVFRLISGVWGPDAIITAGPDNTLVSGIIIAIGVIILVVSNFVIKGNTKS